MIDMSTLFKLFPNSLDFDKRPVPEAKAYIEPSPTEQDHIVRIPDLLVLYNGNMEDVKKNCRNPSLVFESSVGDVFVDQLNPNEVAEFNAKQESIKKVEAELAAQRAEFENFKAWKAQEKISPSASPES